MSFDENVSDEEYFAPILLRRSSSIWTSSHMSLSIEVFNQLVKHYKAILSLVETDYSREGLIKTPSRVAKTLLDFTSGYRIDPASAR